MLRKKYTREDIEELKKRNPEELSAKEKMLANLKPAKKGEVRNPKGRGGGAKNWKTHFQRLMGDEEFLNTIITQLPREWDGVVEKYPASVIAAGLIASTTQSVAINLTQSNCFVQFHLRKSFPRSI